MPFLSPHQVPDTSTGGGGEGKERSCPANAFPTMLKSRETGKDYSVQRIPSTGNMGYIIFKLRLNVVFQVVQGPRFKV